MNGEIPTMPSCPTTAISADANLILEEGRYRKVMQAIDARSDLAKGYQKRISEASLRQGISASVDEVEEALGDLVVSPFKGLSDDVIRLVDQNVETLLQVEDRLRGGTTAI